jgi:gluconolactonase
MKHLIVLCVLASSLFAVEHSLPPTVAEGAKLEAVYEEKSFFEGPAWDAAGKKLYFTSHAGKKHSIMRLEEKGKATVWLEPSQGVNGMRVSKDGHLLGAQAYAKRILKYTFGGEKAGEPKVLCESADIVEPNDLWEMPNGDIYFTDPDFRGKKNSAVYRIGKDGKPVKIISEMKMPNGIAGSPDGKTLYVADSVEKLWRSYPIKEDGSVGDGKVFFNPETESKADPDGMAMDESGNLYFTGRGGVWVVSPDGKELGFIAVPEFVSNATFGGEDGKTLYLTCSNKVYALKMTVRGILFKG